MIRGMTPDAIAARDSYMEDHGYLSCADWAELPWRVREHYVVAAREQRILSEVADLCLQPSRPQWMDVHHDSVEQESMLTELWDENIDYVLALRAIASLSSGCTASADLAIDLAEQVLAKYSQEDVC